FDAGQARLKARLRVQRVVDAGLEQGRRAVLFIEQGEFDARRACVGIAEQHDGAYGPCAQGSEGGEAQSELAESCSKRRRFGVPRRRHEDLTYPPAYPRTLGAAELRSRKHGGSRRMPDGVVPAWVTTWLQGVYLDSQANSSSRQGASPVAGEAPPG